jgi:hypothetical protein
MATLIPLLPDDLLWIAFDFVWPVAKNCFPFKVDNISSNEYLKYKSLMLVSEKRNIRQAC